MPIHGAAVNKSSLTPYAPYALTGLQEKGAVAPVSLTVKKEVMSMHKPEGKDHGKTGGKSMLLIGGAMMVVMMLAIML